MMAATLPMRFFLLLRRRLTTSRRASGSLTYHCTKHKGETGSIVLQPVVPMPPLTALLFHSPLTILSALPRTHKARPAGSR